MIKVIFKKLYQISWYVFAQGNIKGPHSDLRQFLTTESPLKVMNLYISC